MGVRSPGNVCGDPALNGVSGARQAGYRRAAGLSPNDSAFFAALADVANTDLECRAIGKAALIFNGVYCYAIEDE